MSFYRRNSLVREQIEKHGAGYGTPLFDKERNFSGAPNSVRLANDTKKLSHIVLTMDKRRFSEARKKVFFALRQIEPATNEEVTDFLKTKINKVVGRMFELRHMGVEGKPLVIHAGRRKCPITGNVVATWRVNPIFELTDEFVKKLETMEFESFDASRKAGLAQDEQNGK